MKKRMMSMALCLCMALSLAVPVGAVVAEDMKNFDDPYILASTDIGDMSQEQVDAITTSIQNFSDEEYDAFMAYMVNESDDHDALRDTMAQVGVDLSEVRTVEYNPYEEDGISPQKTDIGNATLSFYDSSKTGQVNRVLGVNVQLKVAESRPGSYDSVIIYFDSSMANFYATNGSTYMILKSSAKKNEGTLVYNFLDGGAGKNYAYATVEITPKVKGTLQYSAEWIHTYKVTNVDVSFEPTINFEGRGKVSGSVGVKITPKTGEENWQRAATGHFNIKHV